MHTSLVDHTATWRIEGTRVVSHDAIDGRTAHGLNPRIHTIARIRNPEYGKQIFTMRDVYKLSLMVNPEKQAAREIERLIKYPGFLQRDTFARSRVEIVPFAISFAVLLAGLFLAWREAYGGKR